MYPVTPEFKDAIRRSHVAIVRAEVWRGDLQLDVDLEVIGGQVEIDGRRAIRRTCEVTLAVPGPTFRLDRQAGTYTQLADAADDYDELATVATSYALLVPFADPTVETVESPIVPDTATSPLAPFGNELRLYRGVQVRRRVILSTSYDDLAAAFGTYDDAAADVASYNLLATLSDDVTVVDELVPLGAFLITDAVAETGAGGTTVTVKGSDRAKRISRNRWASPYTIVDTPTEQAIAELLVDRWLDVEVDLAATGRTVSRATFGSGADNDPWADARQLAEAAGFELYFDGDGVATMTQPPDYSSAPPVATYLENDEAMVLAVTRNLTSERSYNGVIATGEGSDLAAVYRAEAWDDDPASPTYRFGPYGSYPRFWSSPLLSSDAEAAAAAESMLARIRGLVEAVEWDQIVDPSLEPGDLIEVHNAQAKLRRAMVLDRVTIPLSASASMSAVTRSIRSTGGFDSGDDE